MEEGQGAGFNTTTSRNTQDCLLSSHVWKTDLDEGLVGRSATVWPLPSLQGKRVRVRWCQRDVDHTGVFCPVDVSAWLLLTRQQLKSKPSESSWLDK